MIYETTQVQENKTKVSLTVQLTHVLAGFTIGIVLCLVSRFTVGVVEVPLPSSIEAAQGVSTLNYLLRVLQLLIPFLAAIAGLYVARTKPIAALTSVWGTVATIFAFVALIASLVGLFFLFLTMMGGYC